MPECPTCGSQHETERGVNIHHNHKHGESIALETMTCNYCGKEQEYYPSFENGEYCDKSCMGKARIGENNPAKQDGVGEKISEALSGRDCPDFRGNNNPATRPEVRKKISESHKGKTLSEEHKRKISETLVDHWSENKHPFESFQGENHPQWKGGDVTVACANCGEEKEVSPSNVNNRNFCDTGCFGEWKSENWIGENHPRWKDNSVNIVCDQCGNDYPVPEWEEDRSRFCSRACNNQWISENQTGENHPRWKSDKEESYGKSWTSKLREEVRKRDDRTCQRCGIDSSEYPRRLDVHHIVPFSEFGLERHTEANDKSNLTTLCRSCHIAAESLGK